jgi:hypothetical protein
MEYKTYWEYLNHPRFRAIRHEAMKFAGWLCQDCKQNKATEVHHIRYPPWGEFDSMENLIPVCHICHSKRHGKEPRTFQGHSQHTERKEFEIEGVTNMRFNQFKNKYFNFNRVFCADVFCGRGTNELGGEVVYGSPIRLLNGYTKANNSKLNKDVHFWFSDIRQNACNALEKLVNELGFARKNEINIQKMDAKDAVNVLGDALLKHQDAYLYLILDPNGPKDFPKHEVMDLISAFHGRMDIIPYISATSIKRCVSARKKANLDFKGWLADIEDFDEGFVSALTQNGRPGWIRAPIKGDPQHWTMLPTFGRMAPKYGWEKQGYFDLKSQQGQKAIKFYCGEG